MENGVKEFEDIFSTPEIDLLKAHQKALLEAVLEEVRGSKMPDRNSNGDLQITRADGCNVALQDIETIINNAIDTCGTQQKE